MHRESWLNIYVRKSTALCTNTTQELLQDLQQKGFNTLATIMTTRPWTWWQQSQGGKTQDSGNNHHLLTFSTRQPSSTQLWPSSTTMFSWPFLVTEENLEPYTKNFVFLWTRNVEAATIQKEDWWLQNVSASLDSGGLQLQHHRELANGLWLNLMAQSHSEVLTTISPRQWDTLHQDSRGCPISSKTP